ncbi:MAG: hypothetical protein IPN32_09985 [Deltaproteobacteria bacterium]|nr:hypothetical protein [Deltaproteobacteria bacterium]
MRGHSHAKAVGRAVLPLARGFDDDREDGMAQGQGQGGTDASEGAHQVKGSAFVTVARWMSKCGDAELRTRYLAALPAGTRERVRDATATQWFPERMHAEVLRAVFDTVAGGELPRFEQVIAECTTLGVQTFAKLVLSMSSPAFVLRRCPTLWAVLRRGPAEVTVDQEGPRSVLHYTQFPFFDDQLYRHYLRALLGALVRPSHGRDAVVEVVDHGHDWVDIAVTLD